MLGTHAYLNNLLCCCSNNSNNNNILQKKKIKINKIINYLQHTVTTIIFVGQSHHRRLGKTNQVHLSILFIV